MAPTGPVLLCYDGSDAARRAIETAAELLQGGSALVLTVWEPFRASLLSPIGSTIGVASGMAKEVDEASVAVATRTAEEGVSIAATAGFDPQPVIGHGKPRDAIVEAAQQHGARVVVMGSHSHGGAEAALFGSVTTGVLHRSAAPVLVVRA